MMARGMGGRARSTSAAKREVERAEAGRRKLTGGRGGRWPWSIVGAALVVVKANGLAFVLHHRVAVIPVLAVGIALSVLRLRPIGLAASGATLLAVALAPRPAALAVAIGVGAYVLLIVLFIAIGAALQARDSSRPSKPA
jgi:hypothetical protein